MINTPTICSNRAAIAAIAEWDEASLARQTRVDALVAESMADPATVEQLVTDIVEHIADHLAALGDCWAPAKADACLHSMRRAIEREARRQAENIVDREGY